MTNGVLSLDDIQASSNGGSSTEAETTSTQANGSDPLETACETLDANYEHAKAYVEEHGNKEDLLEFARRLEDDDELMQSQVEYRILNDVHRIIRNWLRSADAEYTGFTGQFYGDSDDPEPGTYNYVQQQSRENEGNLMFYRALFPEPQADLWESSPVLWHEFDEIGYSGDVQDSHIYVTEDFATEYSDFAIEIEGEMKPVPPSNEELGGGDDTSGNGSGVRAFDPSEFNIEELEDELETVEYSVEQLEHVLSQEKSADGKNRKGAKNAIRDAIDAAEQTASNGGDSGSSDDSGSAAQAAGEMTAEGNAIPPEKVKSLMDDGWTKEEIIELYG